MANDEWDAIPSIDCIDEHLQDSFDFYSVRVPGVGRRVGLEDLSKLVWSVTRAAVSQSRCETIARGIIERDNENDTGYLTISQCERIIREIEMEECDKFIRNAEQFLKRAQLAEKREKNNNPANSSQNSTRLQLCFPGPLCCMPDPSPATTAVPVVKKS
uniref:Uncharacterized protein n=1 Tax=Aureoumbra lagunensis TaxID=44058 RepID=A0A7S3K4C5_9STRA|mmetsp:Transcript_21002/g.27233  ORF Transcript_21002/g.27233 Transcript_21002/m.27233 type:complete len:159 (+) Transcript_21002:61-537(+)